MENKPPFFLSSAASQALPDVQDSKTSVYSPMLESEPHIASGESLVENRKENASSEAEGVAADALHSPPLPPALVSMDAHADGRALRDVQTTIPAIEESETTIEPVWNEGYAKIGMEEGVQEGDPLDRPRSPRVPSSSFSPAPPCFSFPPDQENERVGSEALRQAQDRSTPEEEESTGETHWKAEEERNRPLETTIAVNEEQAEEEEDEEGSEDDPCDALVTEVSRLEADHHIQSLLLAMAQRLAKSEAIALQECISQQQHCTTSLEAILDARWKRGDKKVHPPHAVTGVPKPIPMGGVEGEGEKNESNEKKGMTRIRTNASRQADASAAVRVTSSSSLGVPSTLRHAWAYLTAVEVESLVDTQRREKRWDRGGAFQWREEEEDVMTSHLERDETRRQEWAIGTAIQKRKAEREGGEGHTSREESPHAALPDDEIDDVAVNGPHWVGVVAPQLRHQIAAVASLGGTEEGVPSSPTLLPDTRGKKGTGDVGVVGDPSHLAGDPTHSPQDAEQLSRRESRCQLIAHIRALTQRIAADEGGHATGAVTGAVDAVDEGPRETRALPLVSQWNALLQDAVEVYETCMTMLQATQHIRAAAQHHWHTLCHGSSSPMAAASSLSSSPGLVQQAMSRWARRVDHVTDAALVEMLRWSKANATQREKRRTLEVGVVTRVLSSLSSCGTMGHKRSRDDASDVVSDMKARLQHEWEKASLSSTVTAASPSCIDRSPFSHWVAPVAELDAKLAYWSAMCRQLRYEAGVWCNGWHAVQAIPTRTSKGGGEERMEVKEKASGEDASVFFPPSTRDTLALDAGRSESASGEVGSSLAVPSAMRGASRPPLYTLATTLHTLLHEWRVALFRHIFHSPPLQVESSPSFASLARLCSTLTSSAGPMAWRDLGTSTACSHTAAENGAPNTTGRPIPTRTPPFSSSSSTAEWPSFPIPFTVSTPFSPSSLEPVSSFLPRRPYEDSMASMAEDTRDLATVPCAVPFPTEEAGETQGQEKEEGEGRLPSSPPPPLSGDPLGWEALTFRRLQLLQMVSSRQRLMEAMIQQNAFLYAWLRHAPPFVALLTPPPPSSSVGHGPSETLFSTPADGETARWSTTTDAAPPLSSSSVSLSGRVEEAEIVWRRQEQHLSAYAAVLEQLQTQFRQSFALPVHAAWKKADAEWEKLCYTLRRHVVAEHHHTQQLLRRALAVPPPAAPTVDDASRKDSDALLLHSPYYREDLRALSNAIRAMRSSFPSPETASSEKETEGGGDPPPPYPSLSFALPVLPASAQPLQTVYDNAWNRAESTMLAPCVETYRTLLTSLPRQAYAVRRWAAMVVSARTTTTSQEWPLPSTLQSRLDAQRLEKKRSSLETNSTDGVAERDEGYSLQEIHQAAKDEVAELEQRVASLQEEAARRAKEKDERALRQANRMALRAKLDALRQKVQDGRAELARRVHQTIQKVPLEEEATTAGHKEVSWTSQIVPVPANVDEKEAQDTHMGEGMDHVDGMNAEQEIAGLGDTEEPQQDEEEGEPLQDEEEEPQQDEEEPRQVDEEEPQQDEEVEPQQDEEELALDEEEPQQDEEEEPQQDEKGKGNLPSATVTSSFGMDSVFHNPFASDW